MSDFEQRVIFEPGYNYLHETGPKRRGQHGMNIRFVLIGELGATQFLIYTHWTPLGPVDEGKSVIESIHYDYVQPGMYGGLPMVMTPTGANVGHHWFSRREDWESEFDCEYAPNGKCFYDGSGLRAQELLTNFVRDGVDAVWSTLEADYAGLAGEAVAS